MPDRSFFRGHQGWPRVPDSGSRTPPERGCRSVRGGYGSGVTTRNESRSERFARASLATHGRRIASYLALLLLGVGGTLWLVTDPSGVTSRPSDFGIVLAPALVVLALALLVREIRSGDSRGPLVRRPLRSRAPSAGQRK